MFTARIEPRTSAVADAIRAARLIVVLRRVEPRARLLDLVDGLADAGASVFEITFDAGTAADDLGAVRDRLAERTTATWVGAGTIRSTDDVRDAARAGATFGVSPVFDRAVLAAAHEVGLPFVPGAYSPTEVDAAWRAGAAFVKLFPASSLGPIHVRELQGPLPEVEVIVTGGVDASNAAAFLEAGAVAVGVGSALARATPAERRALVEIVAGIARR
jgi:2-dehydro-3-deoxyphosphogluconate aldolase / (4S)-4-hydroxy-2-oxoglutarate aldolase